MLGGGTSLQRALPPWAVLARHLHGVRTATSSAALMIWISAGIDCGSDLAAQAGHGLAVDLCVLRDLPIAPMRPLGILNSARLVGVRALGCVKVIEFMFTGLQSE